MKIILMMVMTISFNRSFAGDQKFDISTKPLDSVKAQEKSELAKRVEGTYALSKGSSSECLPEGELLVMNDGNTQTLIMGGRVLAAGIGRTGKALDNDPNCNYTYEISYSGNIIQGTDTQECGQRKITFHKKIEIQKDKLIVDRDAVENEKVVSQLKCTYKKIVTSEKK